MSPYLLENTKLPKVILQWHLVDIYQATVNTLLDLITNTHSRKPFLRERIKKKKICGRERSYISHAVVVKGVSKRNSKWMLRYDKAKRGQCQSMGEMRLGF